MTGEQKIIELAKLDGFENISRFFQKPKMPIPFGKMIDMGTQDGLGESYDLLGRQLKPIPNYLHSYDAIIPLVQKQSAGIQITIATILYQNCCIKTGEPWSNAEVATVAFQQSPEQLANALLQAKGFEV